MHVPLVAPPKPPPATTITYDETTITVTWTPTPSGVPIQAAPTGDLLPGRTLGLETPTFSYHVYDVSPSAVAASADSGGAQLAGQLRLTQTPIATDQLRRLAHRVGSDALLHGPHRGNIGDLTLESDAPAPACQTLKDTFPPAAPKDLRRSRPSG